MLSTLKKMRFRSVSLRLIFLLNIFFLIPAAAQSNHQGLAVGAQYDSIHVYVSPQNLDKFINSFVSTFGGQPSKPVVTNVLPVPSTTTFRYVMSSVGMLSVFAYHTPIPYPFGQERYGYLVTDMDKAIQAARQAGVEIVVAPFKDAIGRDADTLNCGW